MKKYYLGLAILVLLSLGLTGYVIASGEKGKRDQETNKKVGPIGTKIEDYIYRENKIPTSLGEAGIKDVPSTINYQKLDEQRYKFCVHYERDSSSFDAGPTGLFTGLLFGSSYLDDTKSDEEKTYLDTYTLPYSHKKGDNCQTVKPYLQTDNSDNSNFNFDSGNEI